jgi:hypothetical protein
MGIGMVVDRGAFPGVPDEEELGYWVRLMITTGYDRERHSQYLPYG